MRRPALTLSSVAVLACTLAFGAACTSGGAPPPKHVDATTAKVAPVPFAEGTVIPDPVLRDAVEERVGIPDMGPAEVTRRWTWTPRRGTSYALWATCRGIGDIRNCGLTLARPSSDPAGHVDVAGHVATGAGAVKVEMMAPGKLRVFGDDAKGAFVQMIELHEDGTVGIGTRKYDD